MLLDILTILTIVALIFVIARINKSNTLFWTLVTTFAISLIGGALAARIIIESERKSEVQDSLMQAPIQNSDAGTLTNIAPFCCGTIASAVVRKVSTNPVGQDCSKLITNQIYTPCEHAETQRAGPISPFNTS